jgi:hypothetical protein
LGDLHQEAVLEAPPTLLVPSFLPQELHEKSPAPAELSRIGGCVSEGRETILSKKADPDLKPPP